jgi:hypothetical protein
MMGNSSAAISADTELFLIDESVLKRRVISAISYFLQRGDSAAEKVHHFARRGPRR